MLEKIEEASNIAQDAPEKIKKEFDTLKESIIEEAARMENELSKKEDSETSKSYQNQNLSKVLEEIQEIKEKIDQFNLKMNNRI